MLDYLGKGLSILTKMDKNCISSTSKTTNYKPIEVNIVSYMNITVSEGKQSLNGYMVRAVASLYA